MDYIYGDAFLDCLFCAAGVLSQCVFLASVSAFYLCFLEFALVWSPHRHLNLPLALGIRHGNSFVRSWLPKCYMCPVWAPFTLGWSK